MVQWESGAAKGAFRFTEAVGRIRREALTVGYGPIQTDTLHLAATGLFIYLAGAASEEFSGSLQETMILTHHILHGLLRTELVSANRQKSERL